jgi:hypothetical protein
MFCQTDDSYGEVDEPFFQIEVFFVRPLAGDLHWN